jgi:hypothetical protein
MMTLTLGIAYSPTALYVNFFFAFSAGRARGHLHKHHLITTRQFYPHIIFCFARSSSIEKGVLSAL